MRIVELTRHSPNSILWLSPCHGCKHGNRRSKFGNLYYEIPMQMHTLPRCLMIRPLQGTFKQHGGSIDVAQKQYFKNSFAGSHRTNSREQRRWYGGLGWVMLVGVVFYKVYEDGFKAKDDSSADQSDENQLNEKEEIKTINLKKAIDMSRDLAQRVKDETGSPGLAIAVSVNGETVWSEGLGFADVENRVACTPESIFRIASISKPITMATVARLIESGDLDLDKPVQHYVPSFPEKTWNGEKVTITTRQLVSHLSGIRHYDKSYMKENNNNEKADKQTLNVNQSKANTKQDPSKSGSSPKENQSTNNLKLDKTGNQTDSTGSTPEMEFAEYYIKKEFKTVGESLDLFKDDPLVYKPGSKFLYTTHGWTLISAVVEGITKTPFSQHLQSLLKDLGMDSTYLDENEPIIYHRGRHYMKNKAGRLINTPYVDLSYKWAGGGLISNVLDVIKFGNIMLYSYQATGNHGKKCAAENTLPGFLKPETMKMILAPVDKTFLKGGIPGEKYGMGWSVWEKKQEHGCCREQRSLVSHSGGAIGGSSVLLILPQNSEELTSKGSSSISTGKGSCGSLPRGIVVAMIANMTSVGLAKTALDIAEVFEKAT